MIWKGKINLSTSANCENRFFRKGTCLEQIYRGQTMLILWKKTFILSQTSILCPIKPSFTLLSFFSFSLTENFITFPFQGQKNLLLFFHRDRKTFHLSQTSILCPITPSFAFFAFFEHYLPERKKLGKYIISTFFW